MTLPQALCLASSSQPAVVRFLLTHLREILLLIILWKLAQFSWGQWQRSKWIVNLPKPNDPGVIFLERFASGCSHKTLITRMAASRNCLTVIVTASELAVTTFFPFTGFAKRFDSEHLIPRDKILKIEENGKAIDITFLDEAGATAKITLLLRQAPEFLRTIRSTPGRPPQRSAP